MASLLKLSVGNSLENILHEAAVILLRGGTIAYPTETIYGLGVDATSEQAIHKIFEIKGRDFKNPVSVIIGDRDQLPALAASIPRSAQILMDAFWPGPLTIVFDASERVSPLLTAGTGKIGVRLSSHDFARRLALQTGRPITSTSANLSGAPECSDADAVIGQIGEKIDAVIDLGRQEGTLGSTIIDITSEPAILLRPGVISREEIEKKTAVSIR